LEKISNPIIHKKHRGEILR